MTAIKDNAVLGAKELNEVVGGHRKTPAEGQTIPLRRKLLHESDVLQGSPNMAERQSQH